MIVLAALNPLLQPITDVLYHYYKQGCPAKRFFATVKPGLATKTKSLSYFELNSSTRRIEISLHCNELATKSKKQQVSLPKLDDREIETWCWQKQFISTEKLWESLNKLPQGQHFLAQLNLLYANFLSQLARLNPNSLELTRHLKATLELDDDTTLVQTLISKGADITFDSKGRNPIYYAIINNKPSILAALCKKYPHWIHLPCTNLGESPLLIAETRKAQQKIITILKSHSPIGLSKKQVIEIVVSACQEEYQLPEAIRASLVDILQNQRASTSNLYFLLGKMKLREAQNPYLQIILKAIQTAGLKFSKDLGYDIANSLNITPAELNALSALTTPFSSHNELAKLAGVTIGTYNERLSELYKKLGISCRIPAIFKAIDLGILKIIPR